MSWHAKCFIEAMKQMSLDTTGFEFMTKSTRKRVFLDEISLVVPWSELVVPRVRWLNTGPRTPTGSFSWEGSSSRRSCRATPVDFPAGGTPHWPRWREEMLAYKITVCSPKSGQPF